MVIRDEDIQLGIESSGGNVVRWGKLHSSHEHWTFFYDRTDLFSAFGCGLTVRDVRECLPAVLPHGVQKNDIIAMAMGGAIKKKWLEAYGHMEGANPHFSPLLR